MKRIHRTLCLLTFSAIASLALVASAAAQTVVIGTGNPDLDVPAVQAAVDQGGEVFLKGHFSFDSPPTVPTAPNGRLAMVLVSKAVAISGTQDGDHERATIEGGTTPFYVEAPGASVTIQGLRFIRPKAGAILVYSVSGLVMASCKIEGLEVLGGGAGIAIVTSPGMPTPMNPGHPENISGTLLIVNNDMDLTGATAAEASIGVQIFSAGVPGAEVQAHISGNKIRNVTEPAINIRRAVGRVYVERNVITTGSLASTGSPGPGAIRAVNLGSYVIAHNVIHSQWPDPAAKGIEVFSQFAEWPMESAVVVGNEVTMLPPEGTVFVPFSAGIDIRGFSRDNVVSNNTIRGRARAAVAVDVLRGGIPDNTAFDLNRFDDFEPSQADVFIDTGVTDTLILGQRGTVEDHGINTFILPFHPGPRSGE
jgi:hypothetical protein